MIKKLRNQPYPPKWEQEEVKNAMKAYGGVDVQIHIFLTSYYLG
jgi:hypothetical protein